jgi:hypothetical protein
MGTLKWMQLIAQAILVLLPLAIHYRNFKVKDGRTNAHKRLTWAIIILWVGTALTLVLVNYRELSKKAPMPKIEYVLNKVPVEPEDFVTIPVSNGISEITVTLGNGGDLPAENISVFVHFATNVYGIKFDGWNKKPGLVATGRFFRDAPDEAFYIEGPQKILGVGNYLQCPPLTFQATNYSVIGFYVSVSDRHHTWPEARFLLHLKSGFGMNSNHGYGTD